MATIKPVQISKRGKSYQLYYYSPNGERKRISVGSDQHQAQRLVAKFSNWLMHGKDPEAEIEKAKAEEKAKNTDCDIKWLVTPDLESVVEKFKILYKLNISILDNKTLRPKPLILSGDTGVGKSLFLHIYSKLYKKDYGLSDDKIVKVNVATLNKNLIESELFGYVDGAFPGSIKGGRDGFIKKAENGILILEEIGKLSKKLQTKLLTFIEDGYYYPIGSENEIRVNVQIIATTKKPRKKFREDFINSFYFFTIPPIYKRRGDILYYIYLIAPEIIKDLTGWDVLCLLTYNWPGNVREIQNFVTNFKICKDKKKNDLDWKDMPDFPSFVNLGFPLFTDTSIKLELNKELNTYRVTDDSSKNSFINANSVFTHYCSLFHKNPKKNENLLFINKNCYNKIISDFNKDPLLQKIYNNDSVLIEKTFKNVQNVIMQFLKKCNAFYESEMLNELDNEICVERISDEDEFLNQVDSEPVLEIPSNDEDNDKDAAESKVHNSVEVKNHFKNTITNEPPKEVQNLKEHIINKDFSEEQYTFYKVGDFWKISFEDEEFHFKNIKGFSYIHYLIENKNKSISLYDLYSEVDKLLPEQISAKSSEEIEDEIKEYVRDNTTKFSLNKGGKASNIKDQKSYYINSIEEINEDLRSANVLNNFKEIERLENLKDIFLKELEEIKNYKYSKNESNLRTSMQKNIKRAINLIGKRSTKIKNHFLKNIITGYRCCYNPELDHSPDWQL